ncbi:uncharacterized protein A4U43_C09F13750 [Asparagus officinalis]|uniref:SBP-type domain-containing protein n=2 Tax=Asparagus officinalis TaxID=4686 RepID=A0A5P1E7A2_ASPOF|nr:uncharacterized protein A4U43_C09F13750 [Asparagus officinalis]
MVGGQEQRFCQQCSRFHLLVEFDEVKRSCRKRLDGHNRRRRKPQPDSMNSGSLFTTHQGPRFSSYPQIFPTSASDPAWPVIVKTEEEPLYSHHQPLHFLDRQHHHHFSTSFTRKHFPFLQDSEPSICQPLLKTISAPENSGNTNKLFSPLDCALSLLSSPPQTSSINLGQIVPSTDRIPMGQPLISYSGLGLGRYSGSHGESNHHVSTTGFSCSGMEDEHVGSTVLVSDASDAEMHCQGLFGVGGGEGSSDGGSQAIPFSWQ